MPRAAAMLAALALLPGCYVLDKATIGNPLPSPEALASVQPGRTTREQVLDLLGAPDEYRQPVLFSALSVADSQAIRVIDEHEVFNRSIFTWVRERRDDRIWLFWPIYVHINTHTSVDRLSVLFDEHDVVSAVGIQREIDAP